MASYSWPDITAGSVRGPVSATTNAIAKFADASGDILAATGVLIDGSDNITGIASMESASSNPASAGFLQMANNEGFAWRNAANSGDITLKVDASDEWDFNGTALTTTELGFVAGVTSSIQTQLDAMVEKTGDTMTGLLTLSGDPSTSLQAATKQYVDGLVDGVKRKTHCKAASTANLTLSGEQTVDGIALVTGDRCLVKDQSSAAENGIYLVDSGSWTRTSDCNSAAEINNAMVSIAQGTANADTGWYQSAEVTTLGSDTVTWVQNFGAGTYVADESTLTLSGSTFSVANGGITNTEVNASAGIVDTKLNTISTAGKVSGAAITSGEIGGSTSINTSGDLTTTGKFVGPGAVPVGAIVPIASNITGAHTIPATGTVDAYGFQYCDGAAIPVSQTLTGNTPDLTGQRFLRGSTSAGGTGGAASVTLTATELPTHSHSINHGHADSIATAYTSTAHSHTTTTTVGGVTANASHIHSISLYTGNMTGTASHTHAAGTIKAASGGSHSHYVLAGVGVYSASTATGSWVSGFCAAGPDLGYGFGPTTSDGPRTNNTGAHTHTTTGGTSYTSIAHSHLLSGNTAYTSTQHSHTVTTAVAGMTANASHIHTITGGVTDHTGNSGSAGSGSSFSIVPVYLDVQYLIRVI